MKPSVMAIVSRVCMLFDVEPDDLLGRGRRPDLVEARHACWYVVRKRLGLSYPAMGEEFGFDHTSIMTAIKRFEKKLTDPDRYPWLIENMSALIQQMQVDAPMLSAGSINPFWRRRPATATVKEKEARFLKIVEGGKP